MDIKREILLEWLNNLDTAHQDGIDNGGYEGSICHQQIEKVQRAIQALIENSAN